MSRKKRRKKSEKQSEDWDYLLCQKYSIKTKHGNNDIERNQDMDSFLESLQAEKESLNSVKSELDGYNIEEWHKHTRNTHLFSLLPMILRKKVKAELPTQAWTKFFTILSQFNIIKSGSNKIFRSFHLCEAPGAFVTSLNHFLKVKFEDMVLHWTATTLNPYYEGNNLGEMIFDDRFLIETLENWDFGQDNSGNIMSVDNFNYFKEKYNNEEIHLVTADGSIDCSDNPSEQEITVQKLVFWEVIHALNILSDGGTFVLKIFTTFEKATITLLFLLESLFEKITLTKPGPSKPGNSEIYIVSENFIVKNLKTSKLYLEIERCTLVGYFDSLDQIVCEIPLTFLFSILECVVKRCALQKKAILHNKDLYTRREEHQENLQKKKYYFAHRFINELGITQTDHYISPMSALSCIYKNEKNQQPFTFKTGSFQNRQFQLPEIIQHSYNEETNLLDINDMSSWHNPTSILNSASDIYASSYITGNTFSQINSSVVCSPVLFKKYISKQKNDTDYGSLGIECFLPQKLFGNLISIFTSDVEIENRLSSMYRNISVSKETTTYSILCYLDEALTEKVKMIELLMKALYQIKEGQTFIVLLDDMLLTTFWLGFFYLLSMHFEKIAYTGKASTKNIFVIVFDNLKSDLQSIEKFMEYATNIKEVISSLPPNVDVLHIVPVRELVKSDFRYFVRERNDCFIKYLLRSS